MERLRWRLLRFEHAATRVLRQRFTPAGQAALAGLTASAIVGVDTNGSMAYQAFCFLVALLALSMLASLRFRARFSVQRTLPRFGSAGQPLPYTLVVRNLGPRLQRGLTLIEETADPRPPFETFAATKGEEAGRHWFDRLLGWSRWRGLVRERSIASVADVALPDLPAGGATEVEATLVPARRGRFKLTGVSITCPDPAGLFQAVRVEPVEQLVMILPKRYPVPALQLPGRRRYQQGGVALSSSVGDSSEFMSLRDYRPGDPLRRIHWRSWAKTGKPIVRECHDEYFVRHALILDTFLPPDARPSPGGAGFAAFEEAVSVAASFACSILTQESLLDLLFVGAETYCFTAGRGLGASQQMLEILASAEPCRTRPFSELRHSVVRRHHTLSGAICVLLAWDDERRKLVSGLQAMGVPVVPMVVTDPASPSGPPKDASGEGCRRLEVGRIAEGLSRL
ncbi:MAG: DUF58 domain-containing protein [Elusimicrobia bacterium]|nr:DUF58 domain-containing protein [Elusimicrobiota bacterium]